MTAFALLFTLSAVGISEAAYLVRTRIAAAQPVCPIGGGCAEVLSSKYRDLFGIPNDILGLTFYIFAAVLTAFLVIGVEPLSWWKFLITGAVAAASVMSAVLVYIQGRIIKTWCFWCLMSACTIWLMGVIIVVAGLQP